MQLSILICSLVNRLDSFSLLMRELTNQARQYPKEVEVLSIMDDGILSVGAKRNHLVHCASGRYVIFVDDDDHVSPDYISSLLKAAQNSADVLTIIASVYIDNHPPKPCYYSIHFTKEGEDQEHYWRWPNHLCAIQRNLVLRHPFPDISFGEDSAFARSIHPDLKTECCIYTKPLYHYRYSSVHTTTQRAQP